MPAFDALPALEGAPGLDLDALSSLSFFSEQQRLLAMEAASLPSAVLIPTEARIHEAVNAPFELQIHAVSPSAHIAPAQLVGEQISLRLRLADGSQRPWHGYVLQMQSSGADGGVGAYRFTVGPWLQLLDLRRDAFVFQDKRALEIIEEVFADYPQAHWRVELAGSPPRRRSLCTQYRETDFAFVTRLMAEEGLSYRFEHLQGEAAARAAEAGQAMHVMVISDVHSPWPQGGAARFTRPDVATVDDGLTHWAARAQVQTNAVALGSWDYKRLRGISAEQASAQPQGQVGRLPAYDGSGAYRYVDAEQAERAAALRLAWHEMQKRQHEGQGAARGLQPGMAYTLQGHGRFTGPEAEFALLSVEHVISNDLGGVIARALRRPSLEQGGYRNSVAAVPAGIAVVPQFMPRPTSPGCQTALVVGLANEPLTTERDLRVKIQFPWQRGEQPNAGGLPHSSLSAQPQGHAPGDERSGTWVRVAQPAAGSNWGAVFTPRIGTEVLVDFIEGDIDRPLVVGQLYNGQDLPPFAAGVDSGVNHPGVISGVHSPTLDRSGYNEWAIDDATGQLRMRLLCSYTAAEIGLGHLIQQAPANAQRGAARGAGFEINTQGWGSLRAARGMMLSTTLRAGTYGSAQSTQMDAQEALGQLKAAHDLAQRLNDAARVMKAQALKPHDNSQSVPRLIQRLAPEQGQPPAAPTVLLDAAIALGITSEAGISSFSGQDFAFVSQGDWHETAAHTASLVSGRTASWYAHQGGIQLKAGNGPVSLRAHTDQLQILADQDVQVLSINDEITITAKTRIELVGGDSKVVLDGADIAFVTPGSFTVKAAMHSWQAATKSSVTLSSLPQGVAGEPVRFIELNQRYDDMEPVKNARYTLTFSDGTKRNGTLDDNGHARIEGVPPGMASWSIGPDVRQWKAEAKHVNNAHGHAADDQSALELFR